MANWEGRWPGFGGLSPTGWGPGTGWGQDSWQGWQGQSPFRVQRGAPAQTPTRPVPTTPQAPPAPPQPPAQSLAASNLNQNWADTASPSGAVSNPFAADNPYGNGMAFTNFFESHPGLAGVSSYQDIREQAPTIESGGMFSNPYGQMRNAFKNMIPMPGAGMFKGGGK